MKATKRSLFEDLKSMDLLNDDTKYFCSRKYIRKKIFNEKYRDMLLKHDVHFAYPNKNLVDSANVDFNYLLKTFDEYDTIHIYSKDKSVKHRNDFTFLQKWAGEEIKNIYSKILFTNLNKIKEKYDNISDIKVFINEKMFNLHYSINYNLITFVNLEIYASKQSMYDMIDIDSYREEMTFADLFRGNERLFPPAYNVVIEFDFNNNNKIYFLCSAMLDYIRNVSNIRDLCFFENIRKLNDKINTQLLSNRIEKRKSIIYNILKSLYKKELNNSEIGFENEIESSKKEFNIEVFTHPNFKKGRITLYWNFNLFNDYQCIKKYLKSPHIYTEFTTPRLYLEYGFEIEDNCLHIHFSSLSKENTPVFNLLDYNNIKKLKEKGTLEKCKKMNEEAFDFFSNIEKKFDKYSKMFSDYLFNNIDEIDTIFKNANKIEKEKNKSVIDSMNNIIKNKNNKSFMDVLTTLVFKEMISTDQVSSVIELTNPKEE